MMKKTVKIISVIMLLAAAVAVCAPFSLAEGGFTVRLGTSYRYSPTVPCVDSGSVYVLSGERLLRLDAESGEETGSAQISSLAGYACCSVACDEIAVYCPQSGGIVEAFDKYTLERLWKYEDSLSGQALSDAVAADGRVFAAFWNAEDEPASLVCLDAQTGEKLWSITEKGGFYRGGCTVVGEYVLIGHDDGTVSSDSPSSVYAADVQSGEIVSSIDIIGDQRSGITFDKESGRIYFTTKAGLIYSADFDKGELSDVVSARLGDESTSTPCVAGGMVFAGARLGSCGVVGVMTGRLETLGSVETPAAAQGAFAADLTARGTCVYFTCNAPPGGIYRVVCTEDGKPELEEFYTPERQYAAYCISSVIRSGDYLYYKNDSGALFAVRLDDNESVYALIVGFVEKIARIIESLARVLA